MLGVADHVAVSKVLVARIGFDIATLDQADTRRRAIELTGNGYPSRTGA